MLSCLVQEPRRTLYLHRAAGSSHCAGLTDDKPLWLVMRLRRTRRDNRGQAPAGVRRRAGRCRGGRRDRGPCGNVWHDPGVLGGRELPSGDRDSMRRPLAGLPRRAVYRASRLVPFRVRRILRAGLGRTGVEDVVPPEIGAAQRSVGFVTLSPSILPGLIRCLRAAKVANLKGGYYEFGLYRGYTLWFAQRAADKVGLEDMRFHGFDSFEGLPEVLGIDASTGEFETGDYACSRADVNRFLDTWGFDWSRSDLTAGLFAELDPSARPDEPASVVLIDCDLYASAVPVLAYLAPRLQDGSILLFDDWNCFGGSAELGEQRAFSEFMAVHPEWRAEILFDVDWHGRAIQLRHDGRARSCQLPDRLDGT